MNALVSVVAFAAAALVPRAAMGELCFDGFCSTDRARQGNFEAPSVTLEDNGGGMPFVRLQMGQLAETEYTCEAGETIELVDNSEDFVSNAQCPIFCNELRLVIGIKEDDSAGCIPQTNADCYKCVIADIEVTATPGGADLSYATCVPNFSETDYTCRSPNYVWTDGQTEELVPCDNIDACDDIEGEITWTWAALDQEIPGFYPTPQLVTDENTYSAYFSNPFPSSTGNAFATVPGPKPVCSGGGGNDPYVTAPFLKGTGAVFLDIPTDGSFSTVFTHHNFTVDASAFEPTAFSEERTPDGKRISFFDTVRLLTDEIAVDVAPMRCPSRAESSDVGDWGRFVLTPRDPVTLQDLPMSRLSAARGLDLTYDPETRTITATGPENEIVKLSQDIPTSKYADSEEASKYAFMNLNIASFPKDDEWSGALGHLARELPDEA